MKKYLLLLFTICATLTVFAQVDRSQAPKAGPAPKVNIGESQSFTLPNGLKVLLVENDKTPKVSFILNLVRDQIQEKEKAGYLDITGDLWGKATNKRDAKQLGEDVDFIGANLFTSSAQVGISGLSKYKDQLMEILSDVLLHPSFPKDEFDKIIQKKQTELKMGETDPGSIMGNISNVTMFGKNHPYGEVVTEQTIGNITVDDCKNYYKDFVYPNHAILTIVGDITLPEAKKLTEQYLGSWKAGNIPTYKYPAPHAVQGRKVVFSNKDAAPQASITVAYPIDYALNSPDQIAVQAMNQILGGGGFQAKLFKNLREDKGYTYGAYSNLSASQLPHSGRFNAYAEVKAAIVDSALMEVLKEMENTRNGNFSEEDLNRVKKTMAGNFSRSLESPSTIANFAYMIERYKLPKDFYTNYLINLDKLTQDDIKAVARKYVDPENAYIFVVGDRSQKSKLEKLATDGKVTELDFKGDPIQESAKVASDMTAEKVIDAYLKAIGGKEKINALKDLKVNSEMAVMGQKINSLSKYIINPKKPMFSVEVSMAGNLMQKVLFDGKKAVISGAAGSQTLEGDKVASLKLQGYPIVEAEYANLGMMPTLAGIEKVNGRDAYKLKLAIGNSITYTFYDVESGLKVKAIGSENGMSQEFTFEDYRPTSIGILHPYLSKTSMQGMPVEVKVTEFLPNTGLKAEDL